MSTPQHYQSSWRKSSHSSTQTNCVEVRYDNGSSAIRDSKNRSAKHITITPQQWHDFLVAVKVDRFD
ncbi:protein of unknown function [Actinopolyspora alba]|uniref:DUF397 domain-containing protein n=1 Tax=Actinopolyspora alba TaxID=673379 RepID=A0A1I1Y860_9ACTN|nr:DUF397 domain-containing protein [Actinopolyspora alba]SFE15754.1 protein of unknown function [Actinopolyspora alba]